MINPGQLPHTVAITSPTTSIDVYGRSVRTYSGGTSAVAYLQPEPGSEDLDGRQGVTTRWRIFTNAALAVSDRVTWGSTVLEVDGPPLAWSAPGGHAHYEARLVVVDG